MPNDTCTKVKSYTSNKMSLRLVVGPDHYHPTHLEVNDAAEMLRLLAIDWKVVYNDTSYKTDLGGRIGEAIHSWNEQWAEEGDEAYPKAWKWLGIAVYGYTAKDRYGRESQLNWGLDLTDRMTFNVNVNADEIESSAYNACREIYKVVSDVVGLQLDEEE